MKNETINFVLIGIAYFAIGLILAGNYVQDKTLKLTQDTVEDLIKIEMITKEQFNLLEDKVERLQNNNLRKIVNN
jgi:hypothetical protein